MNRYFRRSHKIIKIENYLNNCSLGDWFVLYQLSKNLNRPFFMDFLTKLSLDYDKEALEEEETEAPLLGGAVLVPVCYNVTQYNIIVIQYYNISI